MSIAKAFNDITKALGGTVKGKSIVAAIDALNDVLAGSDQEAATSIEGAIKLLGANIGSGGGGASAHKLYVYTNDYSLFNYRVGLDSVNASDLEDTAVHFEGGDQPCKVFPSDVEAGEIITVISGDEVMCEVIALEDISNADVHTQNAFPMPKCDTFVAILVEGAPDPNSPIAT